MYRHFGRRQLGAVLATATVAILAGSLLAPAAQAGNRVTPGNFTGYGFDQCLAPSQAAMDAWLTDSPYWAVGIYIAGDSRACPDQPNLTRTWVSTQLARGWRLLPITVGPQASCSTRDSYQHEARIKPDPKGNYETARLQGRAEAAQTVRAAKKLGITARSTLWYDLEAFSITKKRCRESAISFLSGWTRKLHSLHYVSGVYSSAASGIKMLDDIHDRPGANTLPDRVWIADWNGNADIYSTFVRSSTWMPHKRVHQYRGGHTERYGHISITVDSNYMSLGRGSVAPPTHKACGVGVNRFDYHRLSAGDTGSEVKSLHCLLKRKGFYEGGLVGTYTDKTAAAVSDFQKSRRMRTTGVTSAATWTALLAAGSEPVLKYGSANLDVRRVQRALNAAVDAHLATTGVYFSDTVKAVREYQGLRGLRRTGVVDPDTWVQLKRGNL